MYTHVLHPFLRMRVFAGVDSDIILKTHIPLPLEKAGYSDIDYQIIIKTRTEAVTQTSVRRKEICGISDS
jgi:hypothetical protein